MGYLVELNTLLRPPKDFDFSTLAVGKTYTVTLPRERAFPLRIAVLVIDQGWNFYGYAKVTQALIAGSNTVVTFEMLSLFAPDEKTIYKQKFLEAGKKTGEV